MSTRSSGAALAREAIRLHQRYQHELIERFSICPWAKSARLASRVRAHVVVDPTGTSADVASIVQAWAEDAMTEVAFVIAPLFDAGYDSFAAWSEELGALRDDVFLSAPFHPDAPASAGTIHFLRQSPDPTVQLVRRARLEEIRAQDPPHYADIFDLDLGKLDGDPPRTVAATVLAQNQRLLATVGRPALQAIIDEIRSDRDRSYALFRGQAHPPKKP